MNIRDALLAAHGWPATAVDYSGREAFRFLQPIILEDEQSID